MVLGERLEHLLWSCTLMMPMLIQRQLQSLWHIFMGNLPSLMITMHFGCSQLHHFWIFRSNFSYLFGNFPLCLILLCYFDSYDQLQDLCTICTDFIISELWTSNFLQYQVRSLLLYSFSLDLYTLIN